MVKNKKKILIVEDNKTLIATIKYAIGPRYELNFATTGKEALDKLSDLIPDVIFIDIILPDTSGLVLCNKLKSVEHFKTIPIIFMSSLVRQDDIDAGLALGADDYIKKPFNFQMLESKLVLALLSANRKSTKGLKECPICHNFLLMNTRICRFCKHEFQEMGILHKIKDEFSFTDFNKEKLLTMLELAKPIEDTLTEMINNKTIQIMRDPLKEAGIFDLIFDEIVNQKQIDEYLKYHQNFRNLILDLGNRSFMNSSVKINSPVQFENDVLRILFATAVFYTHIFFFCNNQQAQSRRKETLRLIRGFLSKVWNHSLACGIVCSYYAKLLKWPVYNTFLVGLLHDIGYLVLTRFVDKLSKSNSRTCDHAVLNQISIKQHEKIGSLVANKWNYSKILTDAISNHHKKIQGINITRVIQHADIISSICGYSLEPVEIPKNWTKKFGEELKVNPDKIYGIVDMIEENINIFNIFKDRLSNWFEEHC